MQIARKYMLLVTTIFLKSWGLLIGSEAAATQAYHRLISEFGGPERLSAIEHFFRHIESGFVSDEKFVSVDLAIEGYAKTKKVPGSLVPRELRPWGPDRDPQTVDFGDVLVLYSDRMQMCALYFVGSRKGYFVSRNPSFCPPSFGSLFRLNRGPIFVTGIIEEEGMNRSDR